ILSNSESGRTPGCGVARGAVAGTAGVASVSRVVRPTTGAAGAGCALPVSISSRKVGSVRSLRSGPPSRGATRLPCADLRRYDSQITRNRTSAATMMAIRSRAVSLRPSIMVALRARSRTWRHAGPTDYAAVRSGCANQARSLGQVDRDQPADPGLAHGHAGQLPGRFHGRLVMGDEQELHLFAHLRDH